MKGTRLHACVLGIAMVFGFYSQGQELPSLPYTTPNPAPFRDDLVDGPANTAQVGRHTASEWLIKSQQPGCCGPSTCDGPIGFESYWQAGLAFPLKGSIFGDNLNPGWVIQGGGRSLFFNPETTKAWVVDVGISNTHFNSNNRNKVTTLHNMPDPRNNNPTLVQQNGGPFPTITNLPTGIASLNLTSVNLGLGREVYLWGAADQPDDADNLRVGWDLGGRWGSGKVELTDYPHRDDVIGSFYTAIHADREVPWGACLLQYGVRFEWDYTWTDLLRSSGNLGDISMFNLMFRSGIRF